MTSQIDESDSGLTIEPFSRGNFDAWCTLFEACSSSCFCRFWHFEGDKNAWLLRLATSPEENREAQRAAVDGNDPSARGLVAMRGGEAVGWLKLAPRESMTKLVRLGAYRSASLAPAEGALVVACFLVKPDARRKGVARALLTEAIATAKRAGASMIEAFPRVSEEPLRDEESWLGPASLFGPLGFSQVPGAPSTAYPVLRKILG